MTTADPLTRLRPSPDSIAAALCLEADLWFRDAHPEDPDAGPLDRLLAFLQHDAAYCSTCNNSGEISATPSLHRNDPAFDTRECPACGGQ